MSEENKDLSIEFAKKAEQITALLENIKRPREKGPYVGELVEHKGVASFEFSMPIPIVMAVLSPYCKSIDILPTLVFPSATDYVSGVAFLNTRAFSATEAYEFVNDAIAEIKKVVAERIAEQKQEQSLSVFSSFVNELKED